MKDCKCSYDQNVLIRIIDPSDGMPYMYARQLFNQHGNVFHVARSKDPSIVLVDGEWANQKWVTKAEIDAHIAIQIAQLYITDAGPRIASKLAYDILHKNDMKDAAKFVKEILAPPLGVNLDDENE